MLPRILLISAAIIWGWTFVATRILLQTVTPLELLGLRLIIAIPTLFLIIRARKLSLEFTGHEKRRIGLAALVITAHFLIQIVGLQYTSATNTGWIISVTPLAMAALSFLFLKERLSRNAIYGIVIATAGVLLLISAGDFSNLNWLSSVGDWLILVSAHTWALYTIAIRDLARARNPLTVTFAVFLPAAVCIPSVMLITTDWGKIVNMSAESWIALLFLGLLGSALAQWFWQIGVRDIGASRAGLVLYLEPLATTALAVPYLDEQFGWYTALGGALVLIGVFVAEFKKRKKTEKSPVKPIG